VGGGRPKDNYEGVKRPPNEIEYTFRYREAKETQELSVFGKRGATKRLITILFREGRNSSGLSTNQEENRDRKRGNLRKYIWGVRKRLERRTTEKMLVGGRMLIWGGRGKKNGYANVSWNLPEKVRNPFVRVILPKTKTKWIGRRRNEIYEYERADGWAGPYWSND